MTTRVRLHILFWLVIWLFKGYFQFTINRGSYSGLSIEGEIFANFFPELILTLIKVAICYTIAYLNTNKNWFAPKALLFTGLVFLVGVVLRQATLSIWINSGDPALPILNLQAFTQTTRIMNSVIDNGFALGIFMTIKSYRQQLYWAKREQELINEKLETELNFLKAQTNPHFLFNTLNNFFSMAQLHGDTILADSILKLSGMLRYTLYDSNVKLIPLKKEIEYINSFIRLTKLRYKDEEVIVTFDTPEEESKCQIPPMVLIPFVENALKYGVAVNRKSEINLQLSIQNGILTFSCVNTNYQHLKSRSETSGIGLNNVKRRLELIYPDKHKLEIINDGILFKVYLTISLP
jgi:Histidine kinase